MGIPGENPCAAQPGVLGADDISLCPVFLPVLWLPSGAVGCLCALPCQEFSQGVSPWLQGSVPFGITSGRQTNTGMEAGKVQSSVLPRAFSPDLIPPKRLLADEGLLCLQFLRLQAFSSCSLRVKTRGFHRAGFSNGWFGQGMAAGCCGLISCTCCCSW